MNVFSPNGHGLVFSLLNPPFLHNNVSGLFFTMKMNESEEIVLQYCILIRTLKHIICEPASPSPQAQWRSPTSHPARRSSAFLPSQPATSPKFSIPFADSSGAHLERERESSRFQEWEKNEGLGTQIALPIVSASDEFRDTFPPFALENRMCSLAQILVELRDRSNECLRDSIEGVEFPDE